MKMKMKRKINNDLEDLCGSWDVTTRGQRCRGTRNKASWERSNCATYGVEDVKRHRTGEIRKQKREEQKG